MLPQRVIQKVALPMQVLMLVPQKVVLPMQAQKPELLRERLAL